MFCPNEGNMDQKYSEYGKCQAVWSNVLGNFSEVFIVDLGQKFALWVKLKFATKFLFTEM